MVGRNRAVELGEREPHDVLVGQTESLQHDDLVIRRHNFEQRQLHVGEHERRVGLREQHGSRATCGIDREPARVYDAHTAERVDPESSPRQVGERDPGYDLQLDAGCLQQQHRTFGDVRTTGNRVDDLAVRVRGVDDVGRDRAVHGVEIVARVVQIVERGERDPLGRQIVDRGVAGRA